MTIEFTAKNYILDDTDRELISRRLAFALSRFGHRIRRVTVRVTDENGPKGGIDKRCSLEAVLERGGKIQAEDVSERVLPAAALASDRLARRIDREFKNRRDLKREPLDVM